MRYHRVHITAEHLQSLRQNVGGSNTVHIIVPDDPDFFLKGNGLRHDGSRILHTKHQFGRIHVKIRAVEVFFYFFFRQNIPVTDNSCRNRGNIKFLAPGIEISFLCRNKPFFHGNYNLSH